MLMFKQPRVHQRSIISTLMVIVSVVLLPLKNSSGSEVNGQRQPDYSNSHAQIQWPSETQTDKGTHSTGTPTPLSSNHLTTYILQKLLSATNTKPAATLDLLNSATVLERSGSPVYGREQRKAAEERIFSDESGASIVYGKPAVQQKLHEIPIKRYLDEAKEQIDVIDFTQPDKVSDKKYARYVRRPRQNTARIAEELQFSDDDYVASSSNRRAATDGGRRDSTGSSSEQVPIRLAFPGNDYKTSRRSERSSTPDCPNCVDDSTGRSGNRWTMPLQRLGDKQYYLGIFFKANWYKSEQYCRFHGMHLASINSAEEQRDLQDHIQAYGMGHEHFWTSGTDQGEEGKFFWMSNGKPVTFENWNAGEPNNFVYEDGEEEHCLEMWDRDGKGLKWNDTPCSFSTFFICEA